MVRLTTRITRLRVTDRWPGQPAASSDLEPTPAHQQDGGDGSNDPHPRGDGEVHEALCVTPEHRPDQCGYLSPQHAVLYAVHRVGDVVQRVRQRQGQHPAAGAAMIAALPPPPQERLDADPGPTPEEGTEAPPGHHRHRAGPER